MSSRLSRYCLHTGRSVILKSYEGRKVRPRTLGLCQLLPSDTSSVLFSLKLRVNLTPQFEGELTTLKGGQRTVKKTTAHLLRRDHENLTCN